MNESTRARVLRVGPFAAAIAVCLPLLLRPRAIISDDPYRAFDWLEAAKHRWYARHALFSEGVPAFWNPYLEGGIPSFAHPSDGTASPFFLLTILFGDGVGMKLTAVLLLLIGTAGVVGLARDQLRLSPVPTAFAATAFAAAGWVPSRLAVGFYESLFLLVVPAVLWLVLRAAQQGPTASGLGSAALSGGLLAAAGVQMQLCLVFALLQGALWLPGAALALDPDRRRFLILFSVVAVVVGAGLGAAKFVPMIEFLEARGWRVLPPSPRESAFWGALGAAVRGVVEVAPHVGEYDAQGDAARGEYAFVGLALPAVLLAGVGAVRAGRTGAVLGALAVVTLLLAWIPGTGSQFSLFPALKSLPGFSSMRATDRYVAFFLMLWLCLGAGLGAQALLGWERIRPERRDLVVVLLFVALVPAAGRATLLNHRAFAHPAPAPTAPADAFYQVRTEPYPSRGTQASALLVYLAPQAGVGVQYPPEDIRPATPAALEAAQLMRHDGSLVPIDGYRGEAWFQAGTGTLGPLRPTVNRLALTVQTATPARIIINQNHHPGWTASAGTVAEDQGLIAIDLDEPFDGDLLLTCVPSSVRVGGAISAATAVGVLLLFALIRRKELARD